MRVVSHARSACQCYVVCADEIGATKDPDEMPRTIAFDDRKAAHVARTHALQRRPDTLVRKSHKQLASADVTNCLFWCGV